MKGECVEPPLEVSSDSSKTIKPHINNEFVNISRSELYLSLQVFQTNGCLEKDPFFFTLSHSFLIQMFCSFLTKSIVKCSYSVEKSNGTSSQTEPHV